MASMTTRSMCGGRAGCLATWRAATARISSPCSRAAMRRNCHTASASPSAPWRARQAEPERAGGLEVDDGEGAVQRLHGCMYSILHRHVARLRFHPLDPGADRWVVGHLEAAIAGAVRIGVERDVGDAVAAAGEERLAPQVLL